MPNAILFKIMKFSRQNMTCMRLCHLSPILLIYQFFGLGFDTRTHTHQNIYSSKTKVIRLVGLPPSKLAPSEPNWDYHRLQVIPLELQIGLLLSRATLLLPYDLEFFISKSTKLISSAIRRISPKLSILPKIQPNVYFSCNFISNAPKLFQEFFYIIIQY